MAKKTIKKVKAGPPPRPLPEPPPPFQHTTTENCCSVGAALPPRDSELVSLVKQVEHMRSEVEFSTEQINTLERRLEIEKAHLSTARLNHQRLLYEVTLKGQLSQAVRV